MTNEQIAEQVMKRYEHMIPAGAGHAAALVAIEAARLAREDEFKRFAEPTEAMVEELVGVMRVAENKELARTDEEYLSTDSIRQAAVKALLSAITERQP